MNTNKLWNTKLMLEFRNPKIIKSTIGGILHPRLLWNLFYPNSDIKLRHENFRPESALIQKFMYKNVILLIFNFTIWYILKRTPTETCVFVKHLFSCHFLILKTFFGFYYADEIFEKMKLVSIFCHWKSVKIKQSVL